mgnify:CR=1 FL=1
MVWDCDIEATKAYYRQKLQEFEEAEKKSTSQFETVHDNDVWYWRSYAYIHVHHEVYADIGFPKEMSGMNEQFMRSNSVTLDVIHLPIQVQ